MYDIMAVAILRRYFSSCIAFVSELGQLALYWLKPLLTNMRDNAG